MQLRDTNPVLPVFPDHKRHTVQHSNAVSLGDIVFLYSCQTCCSNYLVCLGKFEAVIVQIPKTTRSNIHKCMHIKSFDEKLQYSTKRHLLLSTILKLTTVRYLIQTNCNVFTAESRYSHMYITTIHVDKLLYVICKRTMCHNEVHVFCENMTAGQNIHQ